MPRYNRLHITDLKDYLYRSDIHDAKIQDIGYDRAQRTLTVHAVNPIHHVTIGFTFNEVEAMLFVSGSWPGDRETIISLTVEEDGSRLQKCTQVNGSCLYLLFQTFSGDELHIVSREVCMEVVREQ